MDAELLSDIVEWTGEVSSTGYWAFDRDTGHVSWSEQTYRIFGFTPGAVRPTYELVRNALQPEDHERFDQEANLALEQGKPYMFERPLTP